LRLVICRGFHPIGVAAKALVVVDQREVEGSVQFQQQFEYLLRAAMVSFARRPIVIVLIAPALLLISASPSGAQERDPRATTDTPAAASADRFSLNARSDTYIQLFQRALQPGPNGAIVTSQTALPIDEYVSLDARDVDAPWQKDSLRMEFAAYGRLWPTSSSYERPFDGDVQTASIRYDGGPAWVRLGRQQVAGGAARFARFDGVMAGVGTGRGFFAEGYGGYGVLPRWNGQPGYHHLGSAEGDVLNDVGPPQERGSNWLAGGRVGYTIPKLTGSLSFHEQHETGGLARRNLGLDAGAQPIDEMSVGARVLMEMDSLRFASVRGWVDSTPLSALDVGVEVSRAEPALLLSRQSVLSVFSTDGYEEAGGAVTVRALQWLRFEGRGYFMFYDDTGPGGRGEVAARISTGQSLPTLLRVAYARVVAPKNGYQSVRVSFSRALSRRIGSTLEGYGYFYDEPIQGYSLSSVYAATVSYRVCDPFELLWGGSIASSPYAAFDAQTLVRASYAFDAPPPARRR
jgi:hypothetical protein